MLDAVEPPTFRKLLDQQSSVLQVLWQNSLMSEGSLLTFAKDRGINTRGVVTGDPSEFLERGWLHPDGTDASGRPLFHPFRMYTLHRIGGLYRMNLSFTRESDPDVVGRNATALASSFSGLEPIVQLADRCESLTDLAVLLEPLRWPMIVRSTARSAFVSDQEFEHLVLEYREWVRELVLSLDAGYWGLAHEELRMQASMLDDNTNLYLLLRLGSWEERKRLEGKLAGAMWIRHMAEVVRREFEDLHATSWPEEDVAFGVWPQGARRFAYGSDRPLDDWERARHYLARRFGLLTGSQVRWYVEGETEAAALTSTLEAMSVPGIEVVNLKGALAVNRDNSAVRLAEWLEQDREHGRFSFVSFDMDVAANVKTIRRHAGRGDIVGLVGASSPDFESANFDVSELVAIAIYLDDAPDLPIEALCSSDSWQDVTDSRGFRRRWEEIAGAPPVAKGVVWGRELGEYAVRYPDRNDGQERPWVTMLRGALQGRAAHYQEQKKRFAFDLETFRLVERPAPVDTKSE